MINELYNKIQKEVYLMCGKVEHSLQQALTALKASDEEGLSKVRQIEDEINEHHLAIDDECFKYLALKQPMAKELRFIVACLRINSDLERIGDQSFNISLTGKHLLGNPFLKQSQLLSRMMDEVQSMLKTCMDSFVNTNLTMAQEVFEEEKKVNQLKKDIFKELLADIAAHKIVPETAIDLILISRNLERIGDHATNIAENVIFIESGRDIRHPKDKHKKFALAD